MSHVVNLGDCIEEMRGLADASVDAVVTDPPYELGFMGKSWDATGIANDASMWREVLRVLKPGGHVVAFGGSRTYHRMAVAIEDAGFEVRDSLCYMYGTGFPKSLDVSKAIDKAAGAEREVVGQRTDGRYSTPMAVSGRSSGIMDNVVERLAAELSAPATDAARQWQGWGTALKPAHEPIVLARKPLIGTVAANVQAHGTGALNIDGCRIAGTKPEMGERTTTVVGANAMSGVNTRCKTTGAMTTEGRWPANVILDEEAGAMLDAQSGTLTSGTPGVKRSTNNGLSMGAESRQAGTQKRSSFGDSGGASRFFYCAKASKAEREAGLEALPVKSGAELTGREEGSQGIESPRAGAGRGGGRANVHPTVKPVDLMRWLCRLITPPGGTVLDPFTGSGTTGCAAVLEGFGFIGFEQDEHYAEIARARIEHFEKHGDRPDVNEHQKALPLARAVQGSLL